MRKLNLGILAHVDAGKTTLTERLLYAAGVIDEPGSVDDGSTQTDSLALERQRGITIRSAVVSFVAGDTTVNLIDTPGHPDFIAEVERVLNVLDGAVLVVSAVEGVQAQTRVLMRTLQRLGIPTLIFVNKIDRGGADPERVLQAIAERLTPRALAMGSVCQAGKRDADVEPYTKADPDHVEHLASVLAEQDDALLAAYVEDGGRLAYPELRERLAAQAQTAMVHPVYFGSAITGAGVDALTDGITSLLPAAPDDRDGPLSATVFKVERGAGNEKVACIRVFSGVIRTRDRLHTGKHRPQKVAAIGVFEHGTTVQRPSVGAGQIAKVWGLADVMVGDTIGASPGGTSSRHFPPPTLEAVVIPANKRDGGALHRALTQLAEQDPLINVSTGAAGQISVSLYGEVQKEVIQATLANDFGIDADFHETTTIYVERPVGSGEAAEFLQEHANPFRATIGLRIDPAPPGTGIEFRLRISPRTAPTHIYKNVEGFSEMMEQYVREALREGLHGWQVTGCTVTMTRCDYSIADGPPSMRGPDSTAADFRKLTPLVLMTALHEAGTVVCEPIHRFRVELPEDTLGAVLPALARLQAVAHEQEVLGRSYVLAGDIPAARVHELQRWLPALTRGEGVLECTFDRYEPVRGVAPTRPRTDHNPLNRKEYLLHVLRRV